MTLPPTPQSASHGELRLTAQTQGRLTAIDAAEWDNLASPGGPQAAGYDPFVSWAFLEALEASGCVGPSTGWTPAHVTLRDEHGRLVGAAPRYLKSHSYGEFVFDHAWADAYARAGGRYYPKLQTAVPFTPVTGSKLLIGDPEIGQDEALRATLLETIRAPLDEGAISSAHLTFANAADAATAAGSGWLERHDRQYHFFNTGYRDFQDFLAALTSIRRKNLRRERAEAVAGLEVRWLTGSDITEAHWDVFFAFYMDTGARKWGSPYLNRTFFSLLGERLADKVLLIFAYDGAKPIAGALNLIGGQVLYGRYWGRIEDRPFLHFELCYYQAIDFVLSKGLKRVEAGAQGEHKIARGYEPVVTRSFHEIAHPGLRAAVSDFLRRERQVVASDNAELSAYTPFRINTTPPQSGTNGEPEPR